MIVQLYLILSTLLSLSLCSLSSALWGEGGYIRLKRVNPEELEDPDSDCGIDVTPGTGDVCTKDEDGHSVIPPPAKVCGTSGLLYWPIVPLGVFLL